MDRTARHPRVGTRSSPHELVRDGAFDLAGWSGFLRRAGRRTHPEAEAICPFGFELTSDRSFLKPELARFYVLLRLAPDLGDRQAGLALDFVAHLRHDLERRAPDFARSIGVWRCNRANVELSGGAAGVPLRMVNVLSRATPHSALTDYARYVICCARGILDGSVGEAAAFESSTRARRRLFQLVEMIGRACELALGSPPVERFPHSALYGEELASFARGQENQPIAEVERSWLRERALPALRRLAAAMERPTSASDHRLPVEAIDLYSGRALACSISAAKYRRLRDVIEQTYLAFVEPAPARGARSG